MLFKLSVNNLRKSLRDYTIYFFTLVIGVALFYVFNAVSDQAAYVYMGMSDRREIVDLLEMMMSGVSVFVAGVLGLLVVYASRFLMKRRSREFALYSLLGMSKGKISSILLIETFLVGAGSLVAGLVVGIGLSQLMSALVAGLFEADMTEYKFSVSWWAAIITVFYFAVIYLVVMIFNSVIVSRFKLIDLLQSGKRSEKISLKNPVLCVLIFIASAAALGYAYWRVGWYADKISGKQMTLYIAMGIVSTFLIFWSVSGLLLRIFMSLKSVYYRGLNSFTFRQVSSKVNTMVFSMTVICLMLFVTICSLSAAFSMRNSMNANLKTLCPADFEISYRENSDDTNNTVSSDIIQLYSENGYDITKYFSDYMHFHDYEDESFTFKTALGESYDEVKSEYPSVMYDIPEMLVRLSDYNALMKLYGRELLSLNDDEFIVLCDYKTAKIVRDRGLTTDTTITVFGNTLKSKYDECQDGFINISSQHLNTGLYVVPDSVVDETYAATDYFIGNYKAETKEEKIEIEKQINVDYRMVKTAHSEQSISTGHGYTIWFNTKIDVADASIGLGAIATFIGLYIGLVFLVACGAVLALKELSESVDSISRYDMLRKIGAEEADISKSLFRQSGIFFLLPLLLSCVHSVFGMKFATYFLEVFGTEKMGESIASTSIIILLIYGGYFLVTYFCSKGIIKGKM